jgi:CubicO group peptidase (beta-lactamase class C family)
MSNKALAHTYNGEPRTFGTWSSFLAPASAINSTSREIIKFLAMMIGEYVPAGITEFQKKAAKSFEQKYRLRDNGSLYMGLTWNIQPNRNVPSGTISPYANNIDRLGGAFIELFPVFSNRGQRYGRIYHHGGSLANQYSTFFVVSPETNAAVVVLMNNGGHRSKAERLALRILERALNPR